MKSNTRKQQDAESCDRCGVHVGNGSGVYVDNPHTGDEDRVCAECANKPHNCWHTRELTEALQSLAPAYGDEAHRRVAERMVKDMEAQHTPAPWVVGDINNSVTFNPNQVYNSKREGIAQVYGIPLHTTLEQIEKEDRWRTGLANARLIASAPDLLAALEALAEAAQKVYDQTDVGHIVMSEIDAARAAIAKARK